MGNSPAIKVQRTHNLSTPAGVAELMKSIFSFKGNITLTYFLRILPYLLVRPGALRLALWEEFDFDDQLWTIPAKKLGRISRAHLVPLADQAVDMLTELRRFSGENVFLFPGVRGKGQPIASGVLAKAFRDLGYSQEFSPKDFRSMANWFLDKLGYNHSWIELQLAIVRRGASDGANHLPERRKMMRDWADYLDKLRDS
jgi:integrase